MSKKKNKMSRGDSPVNRPIFQTNYLDDMGGGTPTVVNDVMAEGAAPTTQEWSSWGSNPYPPSKKQKKKK